MATSYYTRPTEAAEACWDEVDLEAREWKSPASRMKMNRDHTVPLSDETLAVLEMMKPLSGNREFIFPGRIKPNQQMNSQTVNASLKRAGFGGVLVSHGLNRYMNVRFSLKADLQLHVFTRFM